MARDRRAGGRSRHPEQERQEMQAEARAPKPASCACCSFSAVHFTRDWTSFQSTDALNSLGCFAHSCDNSIPHQHTCGRHEAKRCQSTRFLTILTFPCRMFTHVPILLCRWASKLSGNILDLKLHPFTPQEDDFILQVQLTQPQQPPQGLCINLGLEVQGTLLARLLVL